MESRKLTAGLVLAIFMCGVCGAAAGDKEKEGDKRTPEGVFRVVVRNPDGLDRMPRDTQQMAAGLAAGYSKVKGGGRVAVHVTRREEIGKERGMAPGKVTLRRYKTVQAKPRRE